MEFYKQAEFEWRMYSHWKSWLVPAGHLTARIEYFDEAPCAIIPTLNLGKTRSLHICNFLSYKRKVWCWLCGILRNFFAGRFSPPRKILLPFSPNLSSKSQTHTEKVKCELNGISFINRYLPEAIIGMMVRNVFRCKAAIPSSSWRQASLKKWMMASLLVAKRATDGVSYYCV